MLVACFAAASNVQHCLHCVFPDPLQLAFLTVAVMRHISQVLSYHVIPEGALRAADLEDGMNLTTAVEDAGPLELHIGDFDDDGADNVEIVGAHNAAEVVVPDIIAGRSVIHVIDHVLVPEGMGTGDADHGHGHDEAPAGAAAAAPRTSAAGAVKAPVALLAGLLLAVLLI